MEREYFPLARLYPYNDAREVALGAIKASSLSRSPKVPPRGRQIYMQDARAATPPPDDDDMEESLDELPFMEIGIHDILRDTGELVFGTEPGPGGVVLPALPGISKQHFALMFTDNFQDRRHRLILRDLGSDNGTLVTYDEQGAEVRSRFDWVLNGFSLPNHAECIVIQLHRSLSFRIVVTLHEAISLDDTPTIQRRLQENRRDVPTDGQVTRTTSYSSADRPIILMMGWLAQGAFGAVSRHWNVSTGEEYACKRPLGQGYDTRSWEREIRAMKSISHDHIVRLCFAQTEPPVMFLEYMRLGNLEDQHKVVPFSHGECLTILRQSLSALEYLHGRIPPMAHRDIKSENILVEQRDRSRGRRLDPELLRVKLSDFGLSKDGTLKTYCGTRTYCPPEVRRETETYTKAVDIWSLGVVLLRFAYGLPLPRIGEGPAWCRAIVREVQRLESRGLAAILQGMLVMEPDIRNSATACLEAVSLVAVPVEEPSLEERPVSPVLPPLERRYTRSIGSYCRLESSVVLSYVEGESSRS